MVIITMVIMISKQYYYQTGTIRININNNKSFLSTYLSVVHWCAFILEFYCCFKFFLWLLLSLFKLVVIGVHFNCCNCCLETLFKIQIDSLSSNHFEICAKMATSCRVLLKIKRHFDCVFVAILQIWLLHLNHRFLLSKLFPFYCYSLRNFTILFV